MKYHIGINTVTIVLFFTNNAALVVSDRRDVEAVPATTSDDIHQSNPRPPSWGATALWLSPRSPGGHTPQTRTYVRRAPEFSAARRGYRHQVGVEYDIQLTKQTQTLHEI